MIEVEMFVRTKFGITKIKNVKDIERVKNENIIKASFNIEKLIEIGDYVNGDRVLDITEPGFGNINIYTDDGGYDYFPEPVRSIESIVTHEQFKNMKYEVK